MNGIQKPLTRRQARGKVVTADPKLPASGFSKQPFQRLGFDLHPLELHLLFLGSPVGGVPIAVLSVLAPFRRRLTPRRHFVQGTGAVIMCEHNTTHCAWLVRGLITASVT